MARRPTVPKFGTWDSENVGYTVYFDQVREGKGGGAVPGQKMTNPNDPQDNPKMNAPARPTSSQGHREAYAAQQRRNPQRANVQHRRTGSNTSATSETSTGRGRGGEPSKFAPPLQYHQLRTNNHPGVQSSYGVAAPRQQQVEPRVSASPQQNALPAHHKASAVPKFGVWDEQNLAGGQGFTMQFEKVKRQKEATRATVPDVPPETSPERVPANHPRHTSFVAKVCKCIFPTVRE